MTYRSHLLLKEIQLNANVLLSLPESFVRMLLVIFCLFLAWLSGLSAVELGFVTKHVWQSVAIGLGIGAGVQLSIYLVTLLAIKRFGRGIYSPWLIRNILPRRHIEWLLIALAFIPPVVMEEILFRSLWLGVFQSIIPLSLLIVGTSIIFGFMHQPQGRLGMVGAGAINAVFCLIFIWTGELLITVIAHYTVNMLQIVTAHFQRDWLENY